MTFDENKIEDFIKCTQKIRDAIENFKGCTHLEILQDAERKNIFFTYSKWESEADLESYRKSDFFRIIWPNTKKMFSGKPEAWTVRNT